MRVNIIGMGKVGQTLLRLLQARPEITLGDLFSRNPASAAQAATLAGAGRAVDALEKMAPADLWFLTVPDDQIASAAKALAKARETLGDTPAAAVHCSGFFSSTELRPLQDIGWSVASCHPVQSFADPVSAATQFPGTYCGIEGAATAVHQISTLIKALGGRPFPVQTEQKALYHAAAVFSNNFTVVLQGLALETWAAAGVPGDVAQALCHSLLQNTAANVGRVGPQAALTGPAARGDAKVMQLQEMALAGWHPKTAELYHLLSTMAQRLKQSGAVTSS